MRLKDAVGTPWPHGVCPACLAPLHVRRRKADGKAFLGCERWPACAGTADLRECMRHALQEGVIRATEWADPAKWDAGRLAAGLIEACDAWAISAGTSPGAEIVRRLVGAGHAPAGAARGGRARTAGVVVRLGDSEEG